MAKRLPNETIEQFIDRIDSKMFGFDKWITLYREDISRIAQKTRACYVLYIKGKIVYVGQTSNARSRLSTHFSGILSQYLSIGVPEDEIYCKVKYPKKYGMEAMLEKRLIKKLQPKLNLSLKG